MARPPRSRTVDHVPPCDYFKPRGVPLRELEEVKLSADELEALRLGDLEGLYHEEAAGKMGVSRQTFGRIIEGARRKVAEALVDGKALRIEGGIRHGQPGGDRRCGDHAETLAESGPAEDGDETGQ